MDPSAKPPASQTSEKLPVSLEEVQKTLDLEEYPGSEIVANHKLANAEFSPDERRFELARKSADSPEKIVKFFEEKLAAKAATEGTHKEILGLTKRGNYVKVHIDVDGSGSKYSLTVISYSK